MSKTPGIDSSIGRLAILPGTFDPITNGHVDILERSRLLFERVIVAVATNLKKTPLFSLDERLRLVRESVAHLEGVSIQSFDGRLVDYARRVGGVAIVRGLRAISDFEYELQMALMNRRMTEQVDTVFMMPSEEYSFLTSTIIKEIAALGGPLTGLVPMPVEQALRKKFRNRMGP